MRRFRTYLPLIILSLLVLSIGSIAVIFESANTNPQYQPSRISASCNTTGVTKNQNGTYTFARLHINSQGSVVDSNNCIIRLVGFNRGWMDSDSVDIDSPAALAQWKAVMPFNVVRIAINSVWYNEDLSAPEYPSPNDMKSLLKEYIQTEEAAGNYVELDIDQQYAYPPCDPKNKTGKCYPQGQADTDFAKQPAYCQVPYAQEVQQNLFADPNCLGDREEVAYQPPALQALADLAKTYGNDPAIIFDVWNEPMDANPEKMTYTDFRPAMDARINTVRQYSNNLIEVFMAWVGQIQLSPYTQNNIIMDFHNYDSGFTGGKLMSTYVPFFHSKGQAVIINEYGGTWYSATVQQTMIHFGVNYDVGSLYFGGEHLRSSTNPLILNPWGQLVAAGNAQILGTNGETGTPTPTPTATETPTPTGTPTPTPTNNGGGNAETPTPTAPGTTSMHFTDKNGNPMRNYKVTYISGTGEGSTYTDSSGNASLPSSATVTGLVLGGKTIKLDIPTKNGNSQIKIDPNTVTIFGISFTRTWSIFLIAALCIIGAATGILLFLWKKHIIFQKNPF